MRNCRGWFPRRWRTGTKLVPVRADAGVHHLADLYPGDPADDDQLHPHHHCVWSAAKCARHTVRTAQSGAAGFSPVPDLFIMSPVIDKIYTEAYQPFSEDKISMQVAWKGAQPLREFMLRQTREADLALFARLANTGELQDRKRCRCASCCQRMSPAS